LQALFEGLQNSDDLLQLLQTHLGIWVSNEKSLADILVKLGIRDGITREISDTCDGLDFEI
jgi:hypothetical protein